MGLDMYVKKVPKGKIKTPVDFKLPKSVVAEKVYYWRKHPNLHGWMEQLYLEKGGTDTDFNCSEVQLDEDDLDRLESDIKKGNLPETVGFFFGSSDGSEKDADLDFIEEARNALKTHDIYYTSWW